MLTVRFNCTITAECDICHLQTVVTGPKRQIAEEELQKRGWTFFTSHARCPTCRHRRSTTIARNRQILEAVDAGGMRYADIATLWGVSKQRIQQVYRQEVGREMGTATSEG